MENINHWDFLMYQSKDTEAVKLGSQLHLTFYTSNYYDSFIIHLPSCLSFRVDAVLSAKM